MKEKKCPSKAVVGDEGKDSFEAKEEGRRKVETKSRAAVLAVRLRGEKKDGERGRLLFHFEVENFRKRGRKEKGKEKRGRPHSSTSDFFAHLSSSMPSAKSLKLCCTLGYGKRSFALGAPAFFFYLILALFHKDIYV